MEFLRLLLMVFLSMLAFSLMMVNVEMFSRANIPKLICFNFITLVDLFVCFKLTYHLGDKSTKDLVVMYDMMGKLGLGVLALVLLLFNVVTIEVTLQLF